MTAEDVIRELELLSDPIRAVNSLRFFKTGPGQYGEGDQFIGVTMPDLRNCCKQFSGLKLSEIQILLSSPIHEHRMAALVLMTNNYKKASDDTKKELYKMYLDNLQKGNINNWDLIDVSCPHIVGAYSYEHSEDILYELAVTDNIWQKRVGIISTFYYLAKGVDEHTYKIAKILLNDPHDLIQKAVGWALREAGKRCNESNLTNFLDINATTMPRTALRYSIERLPEELKLHFMKLKEV